MIGQMICDVCGDTIKGIQRLGHLGDNIKTDDKFEHICPACKFKIDTEIEKLRGELDKDMVSRVKDFILRLNQNPKIAKGPKKEA